MYKLKKHLAIGLFGLLLATAGTVLADTRPNASPPGQDPHSLWQDVAADAIQSRGERWVQPQIARTLTLDYAALQAHLARAPMEGTLNARASTTTFSLPMPDGGFAEFAIVESPMMEAGLAAKYPTIRTYAGQGLHDPAATLRLDVTPIGFHAQVLSPRGDFYIDPYQKADSEHYVAYFRKNHTESGVQQQGGHSSASPDARSGIEAKTVDSKRSGETLRTYRIAIVALPSYSMHFGDSKLGALSAVVTTLNRINGIYERDVTLRFVLVANNDAIIYTINNPGTLRDPPTIEDWAVYQGAIDNVIGVANYDLAQAFGGWAIAAGADVYGTVCGTQKAHGYVSTAGSPSGDAFDVGLAAHVLGHQLGALDNNSGCGSSPNTAMEPGSGSTVMGLAGSCSYDLQPHSDAYLHVNSIGQLRAYTSAGGAGNNNSACGTLSSTGNSPPVVSATTWLRVPRLTPFQLTASASDSDAGDVLSYNWEQYDDLQFVTPEAETGPVLRSYNSSLSPTRMFPSLTYILNNANTPPGQIPWEPASSAAPFYSGEALPVPVSNPPGMVRDMNLRVTVRDNRAGGGGVSHAPTRVTIYASSGPFAVGNIAGPVAGGSSQALTWTVANTTQQPVATSLVNILWSQDGGYTFTTLLANTPNDGSQTVTMPNVATTRARVRIEAANGNGVSPGTTWFDINDSNFTITASGIGIGIAAGDPILVRQGSPVSAPTTIATISGGTPPYSATTEFLPQDAAMSMHDLVVSGSTVWASARAGCSVAAPEDPDYRLFQAILKVTDSANRGASAVIPVQVRSNQMPSLGPYANRIVARGQSIVVSPSAAPLDANNNLSGFSVSPTTLPGGGTVSVDAVSGAVTVTAGASATLGAQRIRVTLADTCGASVVQDFVVNVATPAPDLQLDSRVVNSGNQVIEPNECNTLSLTLGNHGGSDATAISSTLSSSTPGVTITLPQSAYPNIASGAAATNTNAFEISTAGSVACGSTINMTQTTTYAGGGTPSVLNFSLPVGQANQTNYVITTTDGVAPAPGATLVPGSAVGDVVAPVPSYPAGFAFSVYGTPVTRLAVTTNGILGFNATTGQPFVIGNSPLPYSSPFTTPQLFAFWDNLDGDATRVVGGGIYTALSGQAPHRIFDIEWRLKRYNNDDFIAPTIVFTVRLHETTNLIEVVYTNVEGNRTSGDTYGAPFGTSATIGIQNAFSTTQTTPFTQYSHNVASLQNGRKLTFTRTAGFCAVGPGVCLDPALRVFKDGFE